MFLNLAGETNLLKTNFPISAFFLPFCYSANTEVDGISPEPKRRSLGALNSGIQQPQQLHSQTYQQQPSLSSISTLQQSLLSSLQQQASQAYSFAPVSNNQNQSLLTSYQQLQQLQQPNSYYTPQINPTFFVMPSQTQQTSTALGWPSDAMGTFFTAPTL